MKEFKPIAMRCNQQQYDEINQILLDNGCKCRLDDTFDERPYLTNNFSTIENNINNTINSLKDDYNRTVFETWNKDVFLEYCGIETKSKYQIAAEKALEKFKDIQIGDEYMTIRGNRYIANTLPKITEDGRVQGWSGGCYIDCGSGFLWKYNEPDKFGYKINKQNSTEINAYPLPPNPIIASNQLIKKIQPIQLIRKKKIVMDTKINPIKSINTNLKIKNQKLWT